MKLLFAGDLHGSAYYAEKLKENIKREDPDKIILLGDLLYHGPRNAFPGEYDTKKVTTILNELKSKVLAVRGNCDSEVDQAVLDFPMMADYTTLFVDGITIFVTHGHIYNENHLPKLDSQYVFIQGHTHLREMTDRGSYFFLNPGSISLPRGDGIHSLMVYEDGIFTTKDVDGEKLETLSVSD